MTARPSRTLGVDVGGTNLRAVAVDDDHHHVLARAHTPDDLAGLVRFVAAAADEARAVGCAPQAVGIGLPGTVDGPRAEWVPNLPFLDGSDVARALGDVGLPVVLGNDAQLALLGEAWKGAARGVASAVLVSVGTGIGGAVMLDRRVLRGAHGAAGALGWVVLDTGDPGDPDRGQLERVASGRALQDRAARLDPPRSAEQAIADARDGEPSCRELVGDLGRRLGAALAGVVSFVDPALVVVAGGLASALDVLRPELEAAVARWASPRSRNVPIRAAALGDLAGAVGAARAAVLDEEAWR